MPKYKKQNDLPGAEITYFSDHLIQPVVPYPRERHLSERQVALAIGVSPRFVRRMYQTWCETGELNATSLPGYIPAWRSAVFHPDDVAEVKRLRELKLGRVTHVLKPPLDKDGVYRDQATCPHCSADLGRRLSKLADGIHDIVCPTCRLPLYVRLRRKVDLKVDIRRLEKWRKMRSRQVTPGPGQDRVRPATRRKRRGPSEPDPE